MKQLMLLVMFALSMATAQATERISHGRFQGIELHIPASTPQQFVMLLADAAANNAAKVAVALSQSGALVAVIDTHALFADLERDGGDCVSPDGDLENLSHYIQAQQRLPTYHTPILVGDGAGAAFVYAMLAQAPHETFAGGISLHFCPELALRKPLCKDHRLAYSKRPDGRWILQSQTLDRSWTVLNDAASSQCTNAAHEFVRRATGKEITTTTTATQPPLVTAAYTDLAKNVRRTIAPPPRQVADLPLIEVPTSKSGDTFAVFFSGDGGWAGLDKEVAAAIASQGTPVVGVDSLRYFWNARTPESLARDIERIVDVYRTRWQRERVVLIGYSQGADVLPFAINRFDASTRAALGSAVLIGLAEHAQFEFHVGNWLGLEDESSLPTAPEVNRIRGVKVICIYGDDDEDSTCGEYVGTRVRVVKLPGGHHFDGDYPGLASAVLRGSAQQPPGSSH